MLDNLEKFIEDKKQEGCKVIKIIIEYREHIFKSYTTYVQRGFVGYEKANTGEYAQDLMTTVCPTIEEILQELDENAYRKFKYIENLDPERELSFSMFRKILNIFIHKNVKHELSYVFKTTTSISIEKNKELFAWSRYENGDIGYVLTEKKD